VGKRDFTLNVKWKSRAFLVNLSLTFVAKPAFQNQTDQRRQAKPSPELIPVQGKSGEPQLAKDRARGLLAPESLKLNANGTRIRLGKKVRGVISPTVGV
jgi:hypothetical protein